MRRSFVPVATALALTLAISPIAIGGIADSPLLLLEAGKPTLHLYSVPFATRGGTMETVFACTSTDSAPVRVCVEVFSAVGGPPISNDCSVTSRSVDPGGNVSNRATTRLDCPSGDRGDARTPG